MNKSRRNKIRQIESLLSKSDRKKLMNLMVLQISLGILDLAGIAAIGVLGALTISGVSGSSPGNRILSALKFLKIENFSIQLQATFLGVGAGLLLIFKTLVSAFISRSSLRFLGVKAADISNSLISRLLQSDLFVINSKSKQQLLYACTTGSSALTIGVLGSLSLLASDVVLTTLILSGLLLVDWSLAVSTLLLFGFVAFIVHKSISKVARAKGSEIASQTVKSNQEILESFENLREIATRGLRERFSNQIYSTRSSMSLTYADLSFLPNVSKYIVELTVVFGGLSVGASQFIRQDAIHAVATLTLFFAASARIAPAILRIQQGLVSVKVNLAACESALELDEKLAPLPDLSVSDFDRMSEFPELDVKLSSVNFKFPDFELKDINFALPHSTFFALVGPSGSGKTTLADILMGVLSPSSGQVLFNGIDASFLAKTYPGIIGYVPQQVHLIAGNVRDNVLFGFTPSEYDDKFIWEALRVASLEDLFKELPHGLDTLIGDGSNSLSGGQRQRLGIARAVLTKPRLVVFDEATSALDAETEYSITQSLEKLRSTTSVFMIAHRLSTVRAADQILYLKDGSVLALGTFEEIRLKVPDFDRQAQLMGL